MRHSRSSVRPVSYQWLLGKAKANSKVVTDSAAVRSYMSTRKSAREMFQDAQQAGAPQARIDAYRKVVAERPDADITPQAAFMVGFIYPRSSGLRFRREGRSVSSLGKYPKSELAARAVDGGSHAHRRGPELLAG